MSKISRFTSNSIAIAGVFSLAGAPVFAAETTSAPIAELSPTQVQAAPTTSSEQESLQRVNVTGKRGTDVDQRRRSTAAKQVYGREELDRNGDNSIVEVLKRLPGVTIGGQAGRGADIRMRGMGNGYTQVLLNGERPPRGFSLDSIPPDQVERVEIFRGPVAEYSTQAIAGTINIILREDYKQKNIDLKMSTSYAMGALSPRMSITVPGQNENFSYSLSGSAFQNKQRDDQLSNISDQSNAGTIAKVITDKTERNTRGINFAPRLSYKMDNGDTYTMQNFLMSVRSSSHTKSALDQSPMIPIPEYATAIGTSNSDNQFGRIGGEYQHRFSDNAKLNLKISGKFGDNNNETLRNQYDADGSLNATINNMNTIHDRSYEIGAKYTTPIIENHTLASGVEFESGKRQQNSVQLKNGSPQFAGSGDDLSATTARIAAYAQDEFDINERWSAYAGLRWEAIRTTSAGAATSASQVENTSSVWSPLLHAVWRIPGSEKDQLRASLTESYRAPSTGDLIAIPNISAINSPSSPDSTGNPNLKPELAKGVDFGYEHYLSNNSIIGANFFVRSIKDLMRRQTSLVTTSTGPRWVSSPVNIGQAMTKGIELEAKFQLKEFFPEGPALDLRSNYSRFWSSVDDIQGPNNRIDSQPTQTGNIGFDYRPVSMPLTLGASWNWTPSYLTQASDTQLISTGSKRQLDMYALWKINPNTQIRLSANNVTADDALNGQINTEGGINHIETGINKTYLVWALNLELKL